MRSFTDEAAAVVCQTASILRETALLSIHRLEKIPFPRREEADWHDVASQPRPLRFSFSEAKRGPFDVALGFCSCRIVSVTLRAPAGGSGRAATPLLHCCHS